jgi:hypothetical protein
LLPLLVSALERHGHLTLDATVRARVLAARAATLDRMLRPTRASVSDQRLRRRAVPTVQKNVSVRTFAEREDPPPGDMEADLFKGKCGNTYIREERLADLLGDVVMPVQISPEVAEGIACALRATHTDAEQRRSASLQQLDHQRRLVVHKLDRGYDDYVSEKISDEFWTRKSQEWEAEIQIVDTERARLQQPQPLATVTVTVTVTVTAARILELAKQAEFLCKSQIPTEPRRLLETVLSNCTFDRGTLCPTYASPFDLLVKGNETGNWRRERDSNPR